MNRDCAAHIPQRHVERVSFSIRVKSLLIEPVRPRPNERNAAEGGPGLEFFNGGVGPAKDLLTFDLHGKGDIAHRGKNGYGNLILRVFDDNDAGIAVNRILLGSGEGRRAEQRYEDTKASVLPFSLPRNLRERRSFTNDTARSSASPTISNQN